MSKSPETQLEEFLASKPEWIRRYFQKGIGSLKQIEIVELLNSADILAFTSDYEILLKQMPAKWKEYRKRLRRENDTTFGSFLPKGNSGRPLDPKAQEYLEQYSGDSSYADIAKQELQSEPEGEVKTLLIPKESERIRASVRRSRRRQGS